MATLLVLPDDLLLSVLELLPLTVVTRLGAVCHRLHHLSHTPFLWQRPLRYFFFDTPNYLSMRDSICARPSMYGLLARQCCVCDRTLRGQCGLRRCLCVPMRGHLPLRILGLDHERSGSSCLLGIGFTGLRTQLQDCFTLSITCVSALTREALQMVDVVIICTTEGEGLQEMEVEALKDFVRRGGTAILNAFANWSRHNHFNRAAVSWLGIETIPHSSFQLTQANTFKLGKEGLKLPPVPFVPTNTVTIFNLGDSDFYMRPPALAGGGVSLARGQAPNTSTWAYFPRGASVTAAGQVLVTSNFHWLADPHHWHGGTFGIRGDGVAFMNTLAASAIAARRPGP